ncbi:Na/Pi symporter [Fodinisporobacter ferrooxydans]|uniref:Na/Pi symporter n=1 Tax=Fodinisporobacter ferrooxydans TaxID=2901836 RepID=A0ABY4CF60_9BACL|nr:Na/Pi symporter [Alicyclobacillaceae bacterium MYW30-H2]
MISRALQSAYVAIRKNPLSDTSASKHVQAAIHIYIAKDNLGKGHVTPMIYAVIKLAIGMYGLILGMHWMRSGLEELAADKLPIWIQRFVKTPTRGLFTGIFITLLLQSSGAVTVITIGFVSIGTITFADSIGVILGTNIGSTITAQMIALQLDRMAIPILGIGFLVMICCKRPLRHIGQALFGFGMIFTSLAFMTASLQPLAQSGWFRGLLQTSAANPLLGVLAGAFLTALVQSSSATTALTIALSSQHLVALPGAIAIVLGNNIGTCVTAVLAAIGNPIQARQVALAHVLLNVAGVAIFLPFLQPFTWLNQAITSSPAMQVAMAHTLFNIISSLLAWPIARPFASFIEWLLPARQSV